MSDQDIRTPEQIQADLAATRAQMSATVDELVQTLKPSTQVRRAGARAQVKAEELWDLSLSTAKRFREGATETFEDARRGDRDALVRVGAVAAATAGLIGLCVLRAVRRHS
ncbi:MAG: DUF3618 domain-containing protein [Pauljensenia sp.]